MAVVSKSTTVRNPVMDGLRQLEAQAKLKGGGLVKVQGQVAGTNDVRLEVKPAAAKKRAGPPPAKVRIVNNQAEADATGLKVGDAVLIDPPAPKFKVRAAPKKKPAAKKAKRK